MDDIEWVGERIDVFGITFSRPEHWDFRVETEDTYLFWDEDAGSMRVTVKSLALDIDRYLEGVFSDHQDHAPAWRTVGDRKAVTWTADGESRLMYVVTGRSDLLVICSYAYDPELYAEDDDSYAPAIDAGLEQFEQAITSMRF